MAVFPVTSSVRFLQVPQIHREKELIFAKGFFVLEVSALVQGLCGSLCWSSHLIVLVFRNSV